VKKILACLFAVTLLYGFIGKADASLVYSIPDPTGIISFGEFSGGFTWTAGPVQVGTSVGEDVRWSSDISYSVIGNGN
jgi:hypothetical protein